MLCTVVDDGRIVKLPRLVIESGRTSRAASTSSATFPTDFAFPEIPRIDDEFEIEPSSPNSFPVSPATPIKYEEEAVGWSLNLEAEPRGNFIILRGTLTHVESGDMVRAEGIPFRPIVTLGENALGRSVPVIISENRAERPTMLKKEIPILIAAMGHESYRIYFGESHTSYADFHCELRHGEDRIATAKPRANKSVLDNRLLAADRNAPNNSTR